LALGSVVSLVVLLLGGLLSWTWLSPQRVDERHDDYRGQVARVVLTSTGGDVTVVTGPAGVVSVQRRLTWTSIRRPSSNGVLSDGTLTIDGRCPKTGLTLGLGSDCLIAYVLRVPADVDLDVRTEAGNVRVRDLTGEVRATAATGEVTAENVGGPLRLRADHGTISGVGLRAEQVDAEISAGDLRLSFTAVPASVTAVADTGDIVVALPPGAYQVQATADSGQQTSEVTQDPTASSQVTARAGAGSIDIRYAD
jgi:hypothetical protein